MYSDIIRVNPAKCFKLPEYVPLKEATTLFVNYLTAYFTLFRDGTLRPKQIILLKSCVGNIKQHNLRQVISIEYKFH